MSMLRYSTISFKNVSDVSFEKQREKLCRVAFRFCLPSSLRDCLDEFGHHPASHVVNEFAVGTRGQTYREREGKKSHCDESLKGDFIVNR